MLDFQFQTFEPVHFLKITKENVLKWTKRIHRPSILVPSCAFGPKLSSEFSFSFSQLSASSSERPYPVQHLSLRSSFEKVSAFIVKFLWFQLLRWLSEAHKLSWTLSQQLGADRFKVIILKSKSQRMQFSERMASSEFWPTPLGKIYAICLLWKSFILGTGELF